MELCVVAKSHPEIFSGIQYCTSQDILWDVFMGDAPFWKVIVDPNNTKPHSFDNHNFWYMFKILLTTGLSEPLLDSADIALIIIFMVNIC